jgi:hypothetical protein
MSGEIDRLLKFANKQMLLRLCICSKFNYEYCLRLVHPEVLSNTNGVDVDTASWIYFFFFTEVNTRYSPKLSYTAGSCCSQG